ncbi:MAG: non-canonical purine NTP pyrophosphatase [Furfurilactobacillus sp.]|jgi:non-canonical purine NTP pyrophosphatase (RdgB/HAM1 family)|uniref:Non-canonical purine NTP pyrophosphatase n=1 Tax=Furfurilactobacillus milii TaxID=2888272 RepID=A0ABT6D8L7_9LACO|nr:MULTISPECIES: non-canonical purine NTP pyrophosphatase [Furfurilactobacillus]QLE66788.1 Nucleoside 5-triphosphatase RdgB dHAPTP dITP XTP-specific [Furfurilactobacillus rossiae]MCF6160673.1 non-canonical purine NTP pyrophosphatase [Furfurilactobacillus milii]MCF6162905.1 non-canonical purine NTP pyrophosphatase [Furfurilactobacillus milii]MCF6420175.1 non-canonical purine NTP pyrophosphatase [Furfurilactobacillus milii]MCH4010445.1 non-canonical purine NTP pyrophosphatase [Furfurilactobacill
MTNPLFVAATNNRQKFAELARTFAFFGQTIRPYWTYLGRLQFPKEGTADFKNNAEGKATFIQQRLPEATVVADDSGLFVDALPDHFGVTTMRELSAHAHDDAAMNRYILRLLGTQTNRHATLTTTLTVFSHDGQWLTATGQRRFQIPFVPVGQYSVGFDRIMWDSKTGLTLAQLPNQARIPFTPRGIAVPKLLTQLR